MPVLDFDDPTSYEGYDPCDGFSCSICSRYEFCKAGQDPTNVNGECVIYDD